MTTTFKAAQEFLAYRGMSISKKDGEYRVNFLKGGTEDSAYYTNDIEDAMGSGDAMASAAKMRDEDSWATWPRLPLKRKAKHPGAPDVAVLIIGGNRAEGKYVVYETNLFMDIKDDTPCKRYASEHQIVADGWRVD